MVVYETEFIIRPNLTCTIKATKIWKIRSVRSVHDWSGAHRKLKKSDHSEYIAYMKISSELHELEDKKHFTQSVN